LKKVPPPFITLRGFKPEDEIAFALGTLSEIRNPDKNDFLWRFTKPKSTTNFQQITE